MTKFKKYIGPSLLVTGVLAAAFASDKTLDALMTADDTGVTVEQRSDRSLHYQTASVGNPAQMCADSRVIVLAKKLINEQYPSVAGLGKMFSELEALRPKRTIEDERQSIEQQTAQLTSMLPRPEAYEELKKLEGRAARLKERERIEKEGGVRQAPPPQPKVADNEVVMSGEPYPIEYDRDLKRVACRVQYKITGPAYETINAVQGNKLSTAVYTVQPGQNDWIIELLSASEP